jgi:hypothetical protein
MSHRFQLYTYPVLVKLLFNGIYDFGNSEIFWNPAKSLPKRGDVNVTKLNLLAM